jgi:hypothetical protein
MSDSLIVTGDNNVVQWGKYNIRIGKVEGLVIGDQAQVTQTFGGGPSAGPGQSGAPGQQKPGGDAARRHLQQKLVELQSKYDTLSRRIAAIDTDIGRELDSERRWALKERRQGLMTEREQAASEKARIERQLGQ